MDGTRYYLQYKTDYINFDTKSLTLHFSPCCKEIMLENKGEFPQKMLFYYFGPGLFKRPCNM